MVSHAQARQSRSEQSQVGVPSRSAAKMPEAPVSGGFWRSLPGILTAAAAIITASAGLVAALSQSGFFGSDEEPVQPVPSIEIAGQWTANVAYPWDVTMDETFSFMVEGDSLRGTASFLGVPRGIENGRVRGDTISFTTRTQEMLGSTTNDVELRYNGLVSTRGIDFIWQDSRGSGPIRFSARSGD